MIYGINILNDLYCDDNIEFTNKQSFMVIESIKMKIDNDDDDKYNVSYKYIIYTNPNNNIQSPLNYSLSDLISSFDYTISSDTDKVISDCYDKLEDFLDIAYINYDESLHVSLYSGLTNIWCFNETTGTTLYDKIGYSNGLNSGVTINQSGKFDKSYLGGNNEYIYIKNSTKIYSLSVWFYNNAIINKDYNTNNYLIGFKQSGAHDYHGIRFGSCTSYLTNEIITTYNDSSPLGLCGWCDSSASISIGWHHLIIIWNGSKYNIYLDGNAKTTTTSGTPTIFDSDFRILNRWVNANNANFNGKIDQLAIWDRTLTTTEISALYNSGNGIPFKVW